MLYFCGAELVRIVYGGQWDAAIPVFRILALSLPLQMILSTNVPVFQAAGKTNHLFLSGMLNTCCTVSGFLIAAYWGNSIEAVAWSWDITLAINFVNTYFIMHFFTLKESPISYYRSFLSQLINSALTWVIVEIIVDLAPDLNIIVSLLYKMLLILFFTVTIAIFLKQYNIRDITKMSQVFHKG